MNYFGNQGLVEVGRGIGRDNKGDYNQCKGYRLMKTSQ